MTRVVIGHENFRARYLGTMLLDLRRDVVAHRREWQRYGGARYRDDRGEVLCVPQDRNRFFESRDEHDVAKFRLIHRILGEKLRKVVVGILEDHPVGKIISFLELHY